MPRRAARLAGGSACVSSGVCSHELWCPARVETARRDMASCGHVIRNKLVGAQLHGFDFPLSMSARGAYYTPARPVPCRDSWRTAPFWPLRPPGSSNALADFTHITHVRLGRSWQQTATPRQVSGEQNTLREGFGWIATPDCRPPQPAGAGNPALSPPWTLMAGVRTGAAASRATASAPVTGAASPTAAPRLTTAARATRTAPADGLLSLTGTSGATNRTTARSSVVPIAFRFHNALGIPSDSK